MNAQAVAVLAKAGFTVAEYDDGSVVIGHVLDLKFEPYQKQRINRVDMFNQQVRRPRDRVPPLMKIERPLDRYEYWDYMTEKAIEHHQRLQDNENERKEKRRENMKELHQRIAEVYGPRQLPHLHQLLEMGKSLEKEKAEQRKREQEEITNPKDPST